jgi:hypothetical protein
LAIDVIVTKTNNEKIGLSLNSKHKTKGTNKKIQMLKLKT